MLVVVVEVGGKPPPTCNSCLIAHFPPLPLSTWHEAASQTAARRDPSAPGSKGIVEAVEEATAEGRMDRLQDVSWTRLAIGWGCVLAFG